MLRVILDANVFISALLKPTGPQNRLVRRGLRQEFQIILSESIFQEVVRVLQREKIVKRLPYSQTQIKRFLERLVDAGAWTTDEVAVSVCEDPKDDIYLACAKESQADFLISGDTHLLKIKEFEKTKIVTTAEFLDLISSSSAHPS